MLVKEEIEKGIALVRPYLQAAAHVLWLSTLLKWALKNSLRTCSPKLPR